MNVPPDATSFDQMLHRARAASGGCLCVGLDPDPALLPAHLAEADGALAFCRAIVEATADLVCAYKPNVAFFERWGSAGWRALETLIAAIPATVPVIADAKRGDIGNTSRAYADALYGHLGVAACTVNPYLGPDAVAPLLERPGRCAFLLCRTSNPGAGALQDLLVGGEPLYAQVIRLYAPWLRAGQAGLVIGAREQAAFAWAARLAPEAPLLVPGIGAQGGAAADLADALSPLQARRVVVSISRAIIHAGDGTDFAARVRAAALAYRAQLAQALAQRAEAADGAG